MRVQKNKSRTSRFEIPDSSHPQRKGHHVKTKKNALHFEEVLGSALNYNWTKVNVFNQKTSFLSQKVLLFGTYL